MAFRGLPLVLLALMAGACFAACAGDDNPWLSSEYVVSCTGLTPNSSCFGVVSEDSTGAGIQLIREWESPNRELTSPQPLETDSEGQLAYSFFLDMGRYLEGADYSVETFCGNSSFSASWTQGPPMPPVALASYGVWLNQAAPYCVGGCVVLAVFLLAGGVVLKVSGWL